MAARAAFLTFAFFLEAPLSLLANGGTFYTSVVERTGNLVPTEKPLISLETETLNAYIDRDNVGVYVTYLLANHGPADSVTFGFPVDLATPETLNTPNGYDFVLDNSLSEFRVEDGGHPVPIEKTITKPGQRHRTTGWNRSENTTRPSLVSNDAQVRCREEKVSYRQLQSSVHGTRRRL